MKKCTRCGNNYEVDFRDYEVDIDGLAVIIEDVLCLVCNECNQLDLTKQGKVYLEREKEAFRRGGIYFRADQVRIEKGITYEQLGQKIGVSKQRAEEICKNDNLKIRWLVKLAIALNEPLNQIILTRQIVPYQNKLKLRKV